MARVEHSIAEVRRIKAAWLAKYHEDQQAHYMHYKPTNLECEDENQSL